MAHAAGFSSDGKIPKDTNVVVLDAGDETGLRALGTALARGGVPHVPVIETDLPFSGQLTAIGLLPTADRAKIKLYLGALPLLGRAKRGSS